MHQGPEIFIGGVVFGAICAVLANGKGRSGLGWFLLGFFLQCIALVLILVLPDLREDGDRYRRLETEGRRLRERVRLDRMVADQRYQETSGRLAAHDQALGVDTAPPLPAAAAPLALAGPDDPPFAHIPWFYAAAGEPRGPVPWDELRALWSRGEVSPDTWVWSRGMKDWSQVEDISGLAEALHV